MARVLGMVWIVGCGTFFSSEPAPPPEVAAPKPVVDVPTEGTADTPQLAASHILVAYVGAVAAHQGVSRSEAEAQALATELHQKLVDGADFAAVAKEFSDDPSGGRGGAIGAFVQDAVDPRFAEAITAIEEGAYTSPFKTPYGWHVARRDPLDVRRGRHILVSYQGARNSSETHSKAHARRVLDMLELRLSRGASFSDLAAEFSNDTTAKRGGDLGLMSQGQLLPVLEEAVARLKPGQRTMVESAYGWHLVERTE